tara:strand:- start:12428 stop:13927 length:1500 start_codon:yes stop_codon:yes gene_type:complete
MYDKYDDPAEEDTDVYEKTPMDQAKEIGGAASDLLKKYGVLIIIGIIGLLVVFFVYDFFVGSYQEVSFDIKNTEGSSIPADIRINDNSGKQIEQTNSSGTVSLKNGSYTIDVASGGFKTISGKQIEVSSDSTEFFVQLEINKKLELSGSFPDSLFTGEEREITLTVINNEPEPQEMNLVLDDDAEKVMTLEYPKPLYILSGSNSVTVTLKVDDNPKSSEIGDNKDGTIRIEGFDGRKTKVEGKYTLTELDLSDIKVKFGTSRTKADFRTINTGESSEKIISVENETDTEITDVEIELNITSTEFTDKEEVKTWFDFEPVIDSVNPDEKKIVTVLLTIPDGVLFATGKTEETIDGEFVVKTTSFQKRFNIDLVIRKSEAKITIRGISDSYNLTKRNGKYDKEVGSIDITNSGKVILTQFEIKSSCPDSPTGADWLNLGTGINLYEFDILEEDQTKAVPFTIEIPNSAGLGLVSRCNLRISYQEPSGKPVDKDQLVTVTTN